MTLTCVVHASIIAYYTAFKQLSGLSHKTQYDSQPLEFDDSIYGIHLESCYKKSVLRTSLMKEWLIWLLHLTSTNHSSENAYRSRI